MHNIYDTIVQCNDCSNGCDQKTGKLQWEVNQNPTYKTYYNPYLLIYSSCLFFSLPHGTNKFPPAFDLAVRFKTSFIHCEIFDIDLIEPVLMYE